MKKENRLLKNEDFQKVINKKHSFANKSFVVYYLRNNLSKLRIGISVSKKLGKAVVRNKCKRQVRMMCQNIFDVKDNLDILIIIRNDYLNQSYEYNFTNLKYIKDKINKEN